MSLNWVEIDEVLGELSLEGSFLQNVRQADYHHFYFEFYSPGRPRQVLVSLAPQRTRLHEVAKKPPTLVRAPRFVEFLRARLAGALGGLISNSASGSNRPPVTSELAGRRKAASRMVWPGSVTNRLAAPPQSRIQRSKTASLV